MKLICLNVWGGKLLNPLLDFLKKEAETADIFCFQEVFDSPAKGAIFADGAIANLYGELCKALPKFNGLFSKSEDGHSIYGLQVDANVSFGLSMFLKKSFIVDEEKDFFVHKTKSGGVESGYERPKILQHAILAMADKNLNIFNFHGLLDSGHKLDTPLRDRQFAAIRKIMDGCQGKKILWGDFNIRPDTKNIALLGEGMIDLIKIHKIPETRNYLYKGIAEYSDFISDYIFTSKDVAVKSFKVLDIEVSDHLPLVLEFN